MAKPNKIPGTLSWIIRLSLTLLICLTAYRIFFFYQYKPTGKPLSGSMLWLGLRYDLRVSSVFALILLILSSIPKIKPTESKWHRRIWTLLMTLILWFFLFFLMADYYHYDYLKQRLSASALNYLADWKISSEMMQQTYPVKSALASLVLIGCIFYTWHALYIRNWTERNTTPFTRKKRTILYSSFVLVFAMASFGNLGQYPLRWSDAFNLGDEYKAQVALNPFQSFFSSFKFRNTGFDSTKTKSYFPLIKNYYKLPDADNLNFERTITPVNHDFQPNVVLVICESFSASKSSMGGNQLNPTPYFNQLSKEGLYYNRCFTPAFGTARGVWATLTGIPDVHEPTTASRNPMIVDQHILMNDFEGYDKYYFLGGSTTWANIRGLLKNNIDSLQIFEQEQFNSRKVDVWGISDKNLFLEADKILSKKQKPFFAIIQTADNHRPYTIPEEDLKSFHKESYPNDTLRKYGFESNEQLNAFRYTDYTIKTFIEKAKSSSYFKHTIFAFVGDHGIRGDAGNHFPKSFSNQGITAQHVPLLFYAPSLLQPGQIQSVCSQTDVMPTLASMAGKKIKYASLGINLQDSSFNQNRFAFIDDPDQHTIGVVSDQFYYRENLDQSHQEFVSVINDEPVNNTAENERMKKYMQALTRAFYETARYLLFHNKKPNASH